MTFDDTAASPTTGNRTIRFVANDGTDNSNNGNKLINVVVPAPTVVNDSYPATGNVGLGSTAMGSANGVLTNENITLRGGSLSKFGPTNVTVATVVNGSNTVTTSNGGKVLLKTDGSFDYDPPAGYTGADHFFYVVTNAGGDSNVADATLTMSNMIWFIDDSATACTSVASGFGRLANPLSTMASFNSANTGAAPNPQAGETIFVYEGAYTGGLTLRGNQFLIGQGAASSITSISGIPLASFSKTLPTTTGITNPTLTNAAGDGLTLASGVVVHGVTIQNSSGNGVTGSAITTTTLASTVTISGNGGAEFNLTGAATGNIGVAATISNGSAGTAVSVANRSGGTVTFRENITGTGGPGISLSSNTGVTITFSGGINLSTGSNAAFSATRAAARSMSPQLTASPQHRHRRQHQRRHHRRQRRHFRWCLDQRRRQRHPPRQHGCGQLNRQQPRRQHRLQRNQRRHRRSLRHASLRRHHRD